MWMHLNNNVYDSAEIVDYIFCFRVIVFLSRLIRIVFSSLKPLITIATSFS